MSERWPCGWPQDPSPPCFPVIPNSRVALQGAAASSIHLCSLARTRRYVRYLEVYGGTLAVAAVSIGSGQRSVPFRHELDGCCYLLYGTVNRMSG